LSETQLIDQLGWLANGKGYARTEAKFSITRTGCQAELKP
jgi:hypothetical protein